MAQNVAVSVRGTIGCIGTRYGHDWLVTLHIETFGLGPRIVLVHGFTQNSRCWGPLPRWLAADHEVVLVDAPGHGRSAHDDADLFEAGRLILEVGGPATYVGYSMGGRMLLHAALDESRSGAKSAANSAAESPVVERLVLIGATGGIDDDDERLARAKSDEQLAKTIHKRGIEAFIDSWLALPLFGDLTPEVAAREERLGNRPEGLAASLRNCGTGSQLPLWEQLHLLDMAVSVLVGADDHKFASLASRLVRSIGPNATRTVIPGGHAVHLVSPKEVLAFFHSL